MQCIRYAFLISVISCGMNSLAYSDTIIVDGNADVPGVSYKKLSGAVNYINGLVSGTPHVINITAGSTTDDNQIVISKPVTIDGSASGQARAAILVNSAAINGAADAGVAGVNYIEINAPGEVVLKDIAIHPDDALNATAVSAYKPNSSSGNYVLDNILISGSDTSNNVVNIVTESDLFPTVSKRWSGSGVAVENGIGTGDYTITIDHCEIGLVNQHGVKIAKADGATTISSGLIAHCGLNCIEVAGGADNVFITGERLDRVRLMLASRASTIAQGGVNNSGTIKVLRYVDSYHHTTTNARSFLFSNGSNTELMEHCRAWNGNPNSAIPVFFPTSSNGNVTARNCTFYHNDGSGSNTPMSVMMHSGTLSFTDCIFSSNKKANVSVFNCSGNYTFTNCGLPTDADPNTAISHPESLSPLNNSTGISKLAGSGTVTITDRVSVSPSYKAVTYDITDPGNIDWLRPTNLAAYESAATNGNGLTGGAGPASDNTRVDDWIAY